MGLTSDGDHGILRLNDSCLGQSVTKMRRKKKGRQKVDELCTTNLRREKAWNAMKHERKKNGKGEGA